MEDLAKKERKNEKKLHLLTFLYQVSKFSTILLYKMKKIERNLLNQRNFFCGDLNQSNAIE